MPHHISQVTDDSSDELEPLRTLLALLEWEGGEEGRRRVAAYLTEQLGLEFDEVRLLGGAGWMGRWMRVLLCGEAQEPSSPLAAVYSGRVIIKATPTLPHPKPQDDGGDDDGSSSAWRQQQKDEEQQDAAQPAAAARTPTTLASQLTPAQYADSAFAAAAKPASSALEGLDKLRPGQLPAALALAAAAPLTARLRALQQGLVPPEALALLPAAAHAALVAAWVKEDPMGAARYATAAWRHLTEEQTAAVRGAFPAAVGAAAPGLDRPFLAELLKKRLAAAAGAGGGAAAAAPGMAHSAAAAAARLAQERAQLMAALRFCDEFGRAADWVRLHVIHAQLRICMRQDGAVDLQLLATFLGLLGRARWAGHSEASPFACGGRVEMPPPPLRPGGGPPRPHAAAVAAPAAVASGSGGAGGGGGGGDAAAAAGGGSSPPVFLYADDPVLPAPLSAPLLHEAGARDEAVGWLRRAAWQDGACARLRAVACWSHACTCSELLQLDYYTFTNHEPLPPQPPPMPRLHRCSTLHPGRPAPPRPLRIRGPATHHRGARGGGGQAAGRLGGRRCMGPGVAAVGGQAAAPAGTARARVFGAWRLSGWFGGVQ